MFKHYLISAVRNLLQNKIYTATNLICLSGSLAICLFAFLFLYNEWTHDSFHKNSKNIFRVYKEQKRPNRDYFLSADLRMPVGPILLENIPEIQQVVRLRKGDQSIRVNSSSLYSREEILFADPSFLDVFSFSLQEGDRENALKNRYSVIISEEAAHKYFPDDNPIGKELSIQTKPKKGRKSLPFGSTIFTITGVFAKLPSNSSLRFDLFLPYENLDILGLDIENWNTWTAAHSTYVRLSDLHVVEDIESKLQAVVDAHIRRPHEKKDSIKLRLQPLEDVYLNTSIEGGAEKKGEPIHSYVLFGISLLVLLAACINLINFAVAYSSTRGKEIGVRRVMGASSKQLAWLFWSEALCLGILAISFGTLLVKIFIPLFNEVFYQNLSLKIDLLDEILMASVCLILFVGLVSGSLPAFVLSRLKPVEALAGQVRFVKTMYLGRSLTVLQFTISGFLIICTLVLIKQTSYLKDKPIGFDARDILVIPLVDLDEQERIQIAQVFRNDLVGQSGITKVAGTSHIFNDQLGKFRLGIQGKLVPFSNYEIGSDFFDLMGIKIVAGADFNTKRESRGVLVNEEWMEAFGWDTYEGQKLQGIILKHPDYGIIRNPLVLGIVKNFHIESLHKEIYPLFFTLTSTPTYLYIKIHPEKANIAIEQIKQKWKEIKGNFALEYFDFGEYVNKQYGTEDRWIKMISWAAFLSILIAAVGLWGMTALAIQRCRKEIVVKKVLGATTLDIVVLISKSLIGVLLISSCIAWPLAYYLIQNWLINFPFRIEVGWQIFLFSNSCTILVAFITVSYEIFKAVRIDPADSLRCE